MVFQALFNLRFKCVSMLFKVASWTVSTILPLMVTVEVMFSASVGEVRK